MEILYFKRVLVNFGRNIHVWGWVVTENTTHFTILESSEVSVPDRLRGYTKHPLQLLHPVYVHSTSKQQENDQEMVK